MLLLLLHLMLGSDLWVRLSWKQHLLLLLGQLQSRRHWRWSHLHRDLLLQVLLGLLLQLHSKLTDLLLFLGLLVLLSDDLIHNLLHQSCSSQLWLVGFDNYLLSRLNGLLSPNLHQVGSTIMLNNFGLYYLLSLL